MFAAALHLFKELPLSDPASAASFGIAKVDVFTIRIYPFAKKIYLLLFGLIHSMLNPFFGRFTTAFYAFLRFFHA